MKGINMNLIKITLSATLLVSLAVFNTKVSAIDATTAAGASIHMEAPEYLANDLQPGSSEEELYNALRGKGLDLMQELQYTPRGIRSLKKYLQYLLRNDNTLTNYVDNNEVGAVEIRMFNLARDAEQHYHEQARAKQAGARSVIETSTLCLNTICAAIRVVTSDASHGSTDEERFNTAFAQMMNAYQGDTGLIQQLNDHWAGRPRRGGGTADAVYNHAEALRQTIEAIVALSAGVIANNIDRKDKKDECERAMQMFHEAYGTLAELKVGRGIYAHANNIYPGFVEYYKEWLREHSLHEPVIGKPKNQW